MMISKFSAAAILFVMGCSSKPAPVAQPKTIVATPVVTELARRQHTACAALGPTLTQCAVADAKATMSAQELADLKLEETAPKHTSVFIDECSAEQYSSRQIRVLEVCFREATECTALNECLANLKPAAAGSSAPK
jgi:hypothetical protein